MLKRRYYLMQRARDALIIGILAGTMAAAGYTEALTRETSHPIHLRNLHTEYRAPVLVLVKYMKY